MNAGTSGGGGSIGAAGGAAGSGAADAAAADPLARGIWILTTLGGADCLALVAGSEGRESDVLGAMLSDLQQRRSALVDLERKYLLKNLVFPWPEEVNGRPTGNLEPRPRYMPSSCRHENTLDLIHPFVSHVAVTSLSFLHQFHPADLDKYRESVRNSDLSAESAARFFARGQAAQSSKVVRLRPRFSRGTWLLTTLHGTDCLAMVDGSEGREEEVARDLLAELESHRSVCVELTHKYLFKEALFPKPEVVGGQLTGRLLPMNIPPRGLRHENTIDLAHEFTSLAALTDLTLLSELHVDDVARLHDQVEEAEAVATDLRLVRSNLVAP